MTEEISADPKAEKKTSFDVYGRELSSDAGIEGLKSSYGWQTDDGDYFLFETPGLLIRNKKTNQYIAMIDIQGPQNRKGPCIEPLGALFVKNKLAGDGVSFRCVINHDGSVVRPTITNLTDSNLQFELWCGDQMMNHITCVPPHSQVCVEGNASDNNKQIIIQSKDVEKTLPTGEKVKGKMTVAEDEKPADKPTGLFWKIQLAPEVRDSKQLWDNPQDVECVLKPYIVIRKEKSRYLKAICARSIGRPRGSEESAVPIGIPFGAIALQPTAPGLTRSRESTVWLGPPQTSTPLKLHSFKRKDAPAPARETAKSVKPNSTSRSRGRSTKAAPSLVPAEDHEEDHEEHEKDDEEAKKQPYDYGKSFIAEMKSGKKVNISSQVDKTCYDEKVWASVTFGVSVDPQLRVRSYLGCVNKEQLQKILFECMDQSSQLRAKKVYPPSDDCCICMDGPPDSITHRCGHKVCHYACLKKWEQGGNALKCVVCQQPVLAFTTTAAKSMPTKSMPTKSMPTTTGAKLMPTALESHDPDPLTAES